MGSIPEVPSQDGCQAARQWRAFRVPQRKKRCPCRVAVSQCDEARRAKRPGLSQTCDGKKPTHPVARGLGQQRCRLTDALSL
jgi:hypothetical protein